VLALTIACPASADGSAGSAPIAGSKRRAASTAEGDEKKQRKGLYFEFAKKKWENEDSFKLPDGALHDAILTAAPLKSHCAPGC
jgi:hypothetical protein